MLWFDVEQRYKTKNIYDSGKLKEKATKCTATVLPVATCSTRGVWRIGRLEARITPSSHHKFTLLSSLSSFGLIYLTICELQRDDNVTTVTTKGVRGGSTELVQSLDFSKRGSVLEVQSLDFSKRGSVPRYQGSVGVSSLLFLSSRRKSLTIRAFSGL